VSGAESRWRAINAKFKWWELTLIVIGAVAAVGFVTSLFIAIGNKPAHLTTDAPVPPVESMAFTTALAELVRSPIDRGGTVSVLNNGDEFIPELLRTVRAAKHSINFTVYVWKDGQFSDDLLAALLERRQHGVAVRVLLDGFGAAKVSDKKFDPLKQAGAAIAKFRTPKFGQLTRFHRRTHRRAIVIDGEVGFTGGMAVSDDWLGHAEDPSHWRDMMFKVTGPLARSLQSAFAELWVAASGEILVGPEIYPTGSPADAAGVERFIHLVNSPADDDQAMAYFFLVPIMAARRSIDLTTAYFIPDYHFVQALADQAQHGVRVRLMVPGPHTDDPFARYSAHSRYGDLLAAGVEIYEYQPTFIHSKVAVFDGRWSVIGSPNLNSRSRQLDEENALGILDAGLGARLQATMDEDIRRAQRIAPQDWSRRNVLTRLMEYASRVFDHQS
jgi:cardiolipin synthase